MKVKKLLDVMPSLEPPIEVSVDNGFLKNMDSINEVRKLYGDYKISRIRLERHIVNGDATLLVMPMALYIEKPKKPKRWIVDKLSVFDFYKCPYCKHYTLEPYKKCRFCNRKVRKPK